jgi:hypothetical protein
MLLLPKVTSSSSGVGDGEQRVEGFKLQGLMAAAEMDSNV